MVRGVDTRPNDDSLGAPGQTRHDGNPEQQYGSTLFFSGSDALNRNSSLDPVALSPAK
jgi:hypothetical protein